MANKDSKLFDRLREAGLRKEVAKALSQTSENAGKKAERTARPSARPRPQAQAAPDVSAGDAPTADPQT